MAKKLNAIGITSIADLAAAPPTLMRRQFGVVVERTVRELNGELCLELETQTPAKQQIFSTRSFGQKIYALNDLIETTASFVARAAEKLRAQKSLACAVYVFIHTSRHSVPSGNNSANHNRNGSGSKGYYSNSCTVQLLEPSSDTRVLQHHVIQALKAMCRPGYAYAKAGVGLMGLVDKHHQQGDLFLSGQGDLDPDQSGCLKRSAKDKIKSDNLMHCMDSINRKFGRHSVTLAAACHTNQFSMRQELLSPRYTTCWGEIPKVRC